MGKIILLSLLLATTAQAQQFKITFNKTGFKDALPQLCIDNSEAANLNAFFSQNYTALQWCQLQTLNQATQAGAIPDSVGKLISLTTLKITSNNITALPNITNNFNQLSFDIRNSNLSSGIGSLSTMTKTSKAIILLNDNLSNSDLNSFSKITELGAALNLSFNLFTNVDGLHSLKKVNGNLMLNNNHIQNLNGLNNLNYVDNYLDLAGNDLVDDSGLSNLTYVGGVLALNFNPITNVNGLTKLTYTNYLYLNGDPQLDNLSGLANVVVGKNVDLDNKTYTIKIPANAPICVNNTPVYAVTNNVGTLITNKNIYCN